MWGSGPSFAEKVRVDAAETTDASLNKKAVAAGSRVVVVDTNVLVKGLKISHLADVAVTVPEVLSEIRDPKARAAATDPTLLPLGGLDIRDPSEDAMRAVKKFAALTGDLHSLAGADLRLIALAYTLEEETVGVAHLRTVPLQRSVTTRKPKTNSRLLPGWGSVANPEDWAEVDAHDAGGSVREPAMSDMGRIASSHITSTVLDLTNHVPEIGEGSGAAPTQHSETASDVGSHMIGDRGEEDQDQAEGDGGDWEKQCSRRVKRKQKKRATQGIQTLDPTPAASEAGGEEDHAAPAATDAGEDHQAEGAEEEDEADAEAEEGVSEFDTPDVEVDSRVSIITSDFAMQNVILQMGLRLLTPDGVRIEHAQSFAFRCDACFFITLQSGKMFCPRCGNGGTIKKVAVHVDANGVMQIAVHKRHFIRGTRYSLPAPKGGRDGKNPILREDQLLKFGSANRVKKKKVDDDDFSCFEGAAAQYVLKDGNQYDVTDRRNPNVRQNIHTNRRRK